LTQWPLATTSGRQPARVTTGLPIVLLVRARDRPMQRSVDYAGRLTAHLPLASRAIMIKADGSVTIHRDTGS
jgi:endonuclease